MSQIYGATRSYMLLRISLSTGAVSYSQTYDGEKNQSREQRVSKYFVNDLSYIWTNPTFTRSRYMYFIPPPVCVCSVWQRRECRELGDRLDELRGIPRHCLLVRRARDEPHDQRLAVRDLQLRRLDGYFRRHRLERLASIPAQHFLLEVRVINSPTSH